MRKWDNLVGSQCAVQYWFYSGGSALTGYVWLRSDLWLNVTLCGNPILVIITRTSVWTAMHRDIHCKTLENKNQVWIWMELYPCKYDAARRKQASDKRKVFHKLPSRTNWQRRASVRLCLVGDNDDEVGVMTPLWWDNQGKHQFSARNTVGGQDNVRIVIRL